MKRYEKIFANVVIGGSIVLGVSGVSMCAAFFMLVNKIGL